MPSTRKRQRSSPPRPSPFFHLKDVTALAHDIRPACEVYDRFRVTTQLLGQGSYGKIWTACRDGQCTEYVAKDITFDFSRYPAQYAYRLFFAECLMTQFAGQQGIGIPIHAFFLCDEGRRGVVIMDRFEKDLERIQTQLTWEDMKSLLTKVTALHRAGILHRDLFLKNTMYRTVQGVRDIRIIDFGLAIAFEKRIPSNLCAIDYINLLSGIKQEPLRSQCYEYVVSVLGAQAVQEGQRMVATHYETCSSEYALFRHLPLKWIQLMGPATVDTMVWSVQCQPEKDKDIVNKTLKKVERLSRRKAARST